jgi:hypothetical protein
VSGGDDTVSGGDDTVSGGDDTVSGGDDTVSGGAVITTQVLEFTSYISIVPNFTKNLLTFVRSIEELVLVNM